MPNSESTNGVCKRCKNNVITGYRCILCASAFHKSCSKSNSNIKYISGDSVICCDVDKQLSFEDIYDSLDQKVDCKVFKYIIEQKDEVIRHKDIIIEELRGKIVLLNDNISLIKLIGNDKSDIPVINHSSVLCVQENDEMNLIKSDDYQNLKSSTVTVNSLEHPPVLSNKSINSVNQKIVQEKETINLTNMTVNDATSDIINLADDLNADSEKKDKVGISRYSEIVKKTFLSNGNNADNVHHKAKKLNGNNSDNVQLKSMESNGNNSDNIMVNNEWKTFNSKRRRNNRIQVVGSNKTLDLKTVPKHVELHVYRLHPETTDSDVMNLLKPIFPEVECEQLQGKNSGRYSSFKVVIYDYNFKRAMDPTIWPDGTCVSKFFQLHRTMIPVV